MTQARWPDTLIDAICSVIREERTNLGYSVYELSQRSGVSQQAIAYYEKLERRPNLECLAKIAKAMDFKTSEIIAMAEKAL